MTSISGQDLLRYLDGTASTKVLKRIQGWAESKPKRRKKLEFYERIYREFPHIREYVLTEGSEWDTFLSLAKQVDTPLKSGNKTIELPEDVQLLQYVSGLSGPILDQKVSDWADSSSKNQKDLADLVRIHNACDSLKTYRYFDSKLEFENFQLSQNREVTTSHDAPVVYMDKEVSHKKRTRLLWPLALAASVAGIIFTVWIYGNSFDSDELTLFTTTEGKKELFTLSDGSQIILGEHSTLEYFADVKNVTERRVKLKGTGEFDVTSDKDKPFIVFSEDDLIIKVEGTKFSVDRHQEFLKVIRNTEGRIKVSSAQDPSTNVIIYKGETYGYTGIEFVKIEPVDISHAKEYDILHILDHLMESSDWKVEMAPYLPFQGEDKVRVNLDQPYESVLEDLVGRADFSYVELDCEGCYRIVRFTTNQ